MLYQMEEHQYHFLVHLHFSYIPKYLRGGNINIYKATTSLIHNKKAKNNKSRCLFIIEGTKLGKLANYSRMKMCGGRKQLLGRPATRYSKTKVHSKARSFTPNNKIASRNYSYCQISTVQNHGRMEQVELVWELHFPSDFYFPKKK